MDNNKEYFTYDVASIRTYDDGLTTARDSPSQHPTRLVRSSHNYPKGPFFVRCCHSTRTSNKKNLAPFCLKNTKEKEKAHLMPKQLCFTVVWAHFCHRRLLRRIFSD